VHQVDAIDRGGARPPWLPCPAHLWCAKFADRFSASLVNAHLPFLYSTEAAGFVLAPDILQAHINCAYASDGGTMRRICRPAGRSAQCIPGCIPGEKEGPFFHRGWCDAAHPAAAPGGCYWGRTHLKEMQEQHVSQLQKRGGDSCNQQGGDKSCYYNEIVIDAAGWVANLPWLIEATVVPSTASASAVGQAQELHAAFLAAFDVSSHTIPLLRLDMKDPNSPFSLQL